jgi:hypothetical protein
MQKCEHYYIFGDSCYDTRKLKSESSEAEKICKTQKVQKYFLVSKPKLFKTQMGGPLPPLDGEAEDGDDAVHGLVLPANGAAAVGRVVPVTRARRKEI